MRVLIHYHVDLDDATRRKIADYHGGTGMASRADIKSWFEQFGSSMDDELGYMDDPAESRDDDREDQ